MKITQHIFNSPHAQIKQKWETQGSDEMEISTTTTKNQTIEVGCQPHRQP